MSENSSLTINELLLIYSMTYFEDIDDDDGKDYLDDNQHLATRLDYIELIIEDQWNSYAYRKKENSLKWST